MTNEFNLEFLIVSIEELCKQRKMSVKSVLEDCGLKRVVVDNMKKGSVPSIDKIFTLANYFDVSVDYLLGRTNEPNGYNNISNIDTTVNGTQTNGNYNNIHIQTESKKAYSEMIEYLEDLSPSEKRHAVADLMDILEEKYPKKK